jgi:hypothetical protein
MGYTLAMSDEIGDWLTDLRSADPSAATLVGEALAALISEGAGLGPPLVTPVTRYRRPVTLADTLDDAYQVCLEKLQLVRRRVAAAATDAEKLRRQVATLEAADDPATHDRLARLRRLLATAEESERKLTLQSRRIQGLIDAFRTRKEVLKARYRALQSELFVQQILDQFNAETGPGRASDQGAGSSAAARPGESAGNEPEGADDVSAAAATEEVNGIEREIRQEIERALSPASMTDQGGDPPPELLELRPGTPEDHGIRVLFGVEPAGTALLISVLEGGEALRDHYDEAVALSTEVLQQVRDGQAPEAVARTFSSTGEFLGVFFPGEADRISAAAADLAARNRGRTLAAERFRLGLTQAQVAERMGVTPHRVAAIERAGAGATDVGTLAGYVSALGGRLEIVADFGGERVPLRGDDGLLRGDDGGPAGPPPSAEPGTG